MFYNAKLKLARSLCDEANIVLKETNDETVKLEYVRGQYVIHMPTLDATWQDDDPRAIWWWGTFCGLIDRLQPETHALELMAAQLYSPNTPFGQVITRVLATNATNLQYGEYEGKDDWVVASMDHQSEVYSSIVNANPPTEKNDKMLASLNLFDQMCKSYKYGANPPDVTNQELLKKVEEMAEDSGLVSMYNTPTTNIRQIIKITKSILEHLGLDPEEEEEKSKEQQKQEQQKQGKQGEGEEDNRGSKFNPNSINFKDLTEENQDGNPTSLTIEYEDDDLYSQDSYIPYDIKVSSTLSFTGNPTPVSSDKLTKQVANLLKVRSQVRWQGGKRSGRLRSKSIARAVTDSTYDTPFKKKVDNDVLDTCVLLLVDTSGSMNGSRYELATESAIKLSACLGSVHIPNAVVGFSQKRGVNNLVIHKDFTQKYDAGALVGSFIQAEREIMGNNDDGTSLDWADEYITKQKQKRKIIIVLSDGQPACGRVRGNPAAYLKQVASRVERTKDVYAIGIQTESVEKFYSNSKVLHHVDKLEQTVLNVIKDKVI